MIVPALLFLTLDSSRLRVGLGWSGQLVEHFISKESEIDETHRLKLTFRVSGQQDDFWVVDKKTELLGSKIADTEIPPPPKQFPDLARQLVSQSGSVMDLSPMDKGTYFMDRLLGFWLPQNKPDEWKADISTESRVGTLKGVAQFRAAGHDGYYVFTFKTGDQDGALSAKGQMRFDLTSGRLLTARLNVSNIVMPGSKTSANAEVTYTDSGVKS